MSAIERINKCLERLSSTRGLDKNHIHGFDGGAPIEAFLLADDIRAVCSDLAASQVEVARLRGALIPCVDRAFLEKTLSAMEGVIDVADRKTDEFDALRDCVIHLTSSLFSSALATKDSK